MSIDEKLSKHLLPFEWAKAEWQKNIKECPGKLDHNTRIVWYHSLTTLKATDDETPWCSAFMCAAAFSSGYASTRSAAAKSWINYGVVGSGAVGDIAVFKRKGGHHVAFVYRNYKEGDQLVTVLGGNQGNMICVAHYKASDLLALRRFES